MNDNEIRYTWVYYHLEVDRSIAYQGYDSGKAQAALQRAISEAMAGGTTHIAYDVHFSRHRTPRPPQVPENPTEQTPNS